MPYTDCENYVDLLQRMYVIKLIEPFFTNRRQVIGKMKKVYFCDLGLLNIIYGNFNEMPFRTDNRAIFENEILLELWRNRKADETISFYRTQNGTEVDFVTQSSQRKMAVECKYKRFENPVSVAALNGFCDDEGISLRYIANINALFENAKVKFVPGIVCDRVGNRGL